VLPLIDRTLPLAMPFLHPIWTALVRPAPLKQLAGGGACRLYIKPGLERCEGQLVLRRKSGGERYGEEGADCRRRDTC
jgi:hypothetical protein